MKPVYRRIIASLVAFLSALAASAATLPVDVSLTDIPLIAWLMASVSGLTGFYSPSSVERLKDSDEKSPD